MKKSWFFILFLLSLFSAQAVAGPITVLLARTVGVSDFEARRMLDQIDDLAAESGISNLGGFVSASMTSGPLPMPEVFVVSCGSTNGPSAVNCARTSLSSTRNAKSADIVLVMVSQNIVGDCGSVDPDMINSFAVGQANESNGYAVIERGCFLLSTGNQVVASHEVGHLLSIEHVDGDVEESKPIGASPANHAMENVYDHATAVASAGDCLTGCEWSNFFSDKDKDFSILPFDDAGNAEFSDAVNVVKTLSWNAVSLYRTPLPAPTCNSSNIRIEFTGCSGYNNRNFLVTGRLPGYQVTNARYDVKIGSNGIWQIIYNGILTCPLFSSSWGFYVKMFLTTPQGTAQCTKWVNVPSCDLNEPF